MGDNGNILSIVFLFKKIKEILNSFFNVFITFAIRKSFDDVFLLERFDDTGKAGIMFAIVTFPKPFILNNFNHTFESKFGGIDCSFEIGTKNNVELFVFDLIFELYRLFNS